jgi:hypothetical protein
VPAPAARTAGASRLPSLKPPRIAWPQPSKVAARVAPSEDASGERGRPALLGQRCGRHDTAGVKGQQGEQNAQLTATDRHHAPSGVPQPKRAQ